MRARVTVYSQASADGRLDGFAADPGAGPEVDPMPVVAGFDELVREPRPALVVVDSRGSVRNWRHAMAQPWYGNHISLVSASTPREHLAYLNRRGVTVIEAGDDRVDLAAALRVLEEGHGVRRVRTDGGGQLAGTLLAAGCVDELVVPAVSGSPPRCPWSPCRVPSTRRPCAWWRSNTPRVITC